MGAGSSLEAQRWCWFLDHALSAQTPAFFYAVEVKVFQTQDLVANRHAHLGPGAGKVETEGMGSALCTQTADEGTLRSARDFVTS